MGFLAVREKKVRLPRDHFQHLLGTPILFAINFHYFLLLFTTVWLNWCETTVKTIKIIKIHIFGLSTLAAAGNRTPKAEFLPKQAKMDNFI